MTRRAKAEPTVVELRDRLLRAIAPLSGSSYDPEALELLRSFERELKRSWEFGERLELEARFLDAVREVVAGEGAGLMPT